MARETKKQMYCRNVLRCVDIYIYISTLFKSFHEKPYASCTHVTFPLRCSSCCLSNFLEEFLYSVFITSQHDSSSLPVYEEGHIQFTLVFRHDVDGVVESLCSLDKFGCVVSSPHVLSDGLELSACGWGSRDFQRRHLFLDDGMFAEEFQCIGAALDICSMEERENWD